MDGKPSERQLEAFLGSGLARVGRNAVGVWVICMPPKYKPPYYHNTYIRRLKQSIKGIKGNIKGINESIEINRESDDELYKKARERRRREQAKR